MINGMFKDHFDDATFSDLTIRLSDRTLKVHRVVLCRQSQYFSTLLTGPFKESGSNEVELHEDDPQAMVALLRHIYGLPYRTDGSDAWPTSLEAYAELYATAGKYLMRRLQDNVRSSLQYVPSCYQPGTGVISDVSDFVRGVRKILTCTSCDQWARGCLVSACTKNLKLLYKDEEFLSLLRDFGDLGADIMGHEHFERTFSGSWMCSKSCASNPKPSCLTCGTRFYADYAWDDRHEKFWWCDECEEKVVPRCATCKETVVWIERDIAGWKSLQSLRSGTLRS